MVSPSQVVVTGRIERSSYGIWQHLRRPRCSKYRSGLNKTTDDWRTTHRLPQHCSGWNVTGYQATVMYDPAALIYFSSVNGDYLSGEVFLAVPVVEKNYVTLESASLAAPSDGYGTLATITFQVVDAKASGVFLSQATLVDPDGERFFPCIETDTMEEGAVIEAVDRAEDINDDGVVNIQDLVLVSANFGKTGESKADVNGDGVVEIVDLVKVAAAIRNTATAPF